jgi:hypothetical protein
MKYNYSIDEILNAVNELQNKKKKVVTQINIKEKEKNNSKIPKDTLKIIEEAEKRSFIKN